MPTITTPETTTITSAAAGSMRTPASRRLARGGGLLLAAVAAAAVQLAGRGIGADYLITDPTGSAVIDLPTAAGFTLVVGLLGWAVLAGLEHATRHGLRIWTILAVLIVAASMVPVFLVEATAATRIALVVVHLAVGAVLIPVMTRTSRHAWPKPVTTKRVRDAL